MFITCRLQGSLPPNRSFPESTSLGRAFLAMDRLLAEARVGSTHLRTPETASMVVESIRYRHLIDYDLHHFVVMSDHVHFLVTPINPVSKFMHSLKRFTAREANRALGTTGRPFWRDECYDRLVRNDLEFERIAKYIERNPVDAGVVTEPAQVRWSSAWPISNRPQVSNLPHDVASCRHESGCRQTLPGDRDCSES
jgi:REP element-mobilizing transposase RayT